MSASVKGQGKGSQREPVNVFLEGVDFLIIIKKLAKMNCFILLMARFDDNWLFT